jgi:hypothetical protein
MFYLKYLFNVLKMELCISICIIQLEGLVCCFLYIVVLNCVMYFTVSGIVIVAFILP